MFIGRQTNYLSSLAGGLGAGLRVDRLTIINLVVIIVAVIIPPARLADWTT